MAQSNERYARILRAAGHNEAAALITAVDADEAAPSERAPLGHAAAGPVAPLTIDDVKAMTPDQILDRWDDVQAVLATQKAA